MSIRWLPLILLSLTASLAAQQKPGRLPGFSPAQSEEEAKGEPADGERPVQDGKGKGSVPDGPVVMSPRGKCSFRVSIHPEQLMPGQSGTVKIVMILDGDAVMEAPAALEVAPPGAMGFLQAGPMFLHPPQPGNVAAAYQGRPVYDNYAMVELPVVMSQQAKLGTKHTLSLQANFKLHEGATGRFLGDFGQRLTVACEVGKSADPNVQMPVIAQQAASGAGGRPEAQPVQPAEEPVGSAAAAEAGEGDVQAGRVEPMGGAGQVPAGQVPAGRAVSDRQQPILPSADEGSPLTMILMAAGGLLAILVLVLALAKKR